MIKIEFRDSINRFVNLPAPETGFQSDHIASDRYHFVLLLLGLGNGLAILMVVI